MYKYLQNQIKNIENLLSAKQKAPDLIQIQKEHRIRIQYLQHERLIHLLITLFFGACFLITSLFLLIIQILPLLLIDGIFLIMTLAYIFHYFHLENGVQKLYRLDDEIGKKVDGTVCSAQANFDGECQAQ